MTLSFFSTLLFCLLTAPFLRLPACLVQGDAPHTLLVTATLVKLSLIEESPQLFRDFACSNGQSSSRYFPRVRGVLLIKRSQATNQAVEATLYYVRLKTHRSSRLFAGSHQTPGKVTAEDSTSPLPPSVLSESEFSTIITDELLLAAKNRDVALDQWVVVPDAVHALVFVRENRPDTEQGNGKPRLLTSFVAAFKAATAKRINLMRNQPGSSVWQRSYNEQRVEDEFMLNRLRRKISEAEGAIASSQLISH